MAKAKTKAVEEALEAQSWAPQPLKDFPWFKEKLSDAERDTLTSTTKSLEKNVRLHSNSKLGIGRDLQAVQQILEPKNLFSQYLRNYGFKRRTAYNWIAGYENVSGLLPSTIIEEAALQGINLMGDKKEQPFGKYTKIVKSLPKPPSDITKEDAITWLDALQTEHNRAVKAGRSGKHSPKLIHSLSAEEAMTDCVKYVGSRYNRLPKGTRKSVWIEKLVGFILGLSGEEGATTITATEVPTEMQPKPPGRPPMEQATAA